MLIKIKKEIRKVQLEFELKIKINQDLQCKKIIYKLHIQKQQIDNQL